MPVCIYCKRRELYSLRFFCLIRRILKKFQKENKNIQFHNIVNILHRAYYEDVWLASAS